MNKNRFIVIGKLQQKRASDHSFRISSQISSSETSESSPVFYTHLPPPLPSATRLLATGEQTIHRPQTFEFVNSFGMLNQAQTVIVTTSPPLRQDHVERQILAIPSQEMIIGGQNLRTRVGFPIGLMNCLL